MATISSLTMFRRHSADRSYKRHVMLGFFFPIQAFVPTLHLLNKLCGICWSDFGRRSFGIIEVFHQVCSTLALQPLASYCLILGTHGLVHDQRRFLKELWDSGKFSLRSITELFQDHSLPHPHPKSPPGLLQMQQHYGAKAGKLWQRGRTTGAT